MCAQWLHVSLDAALPGSAPRCGKEAREAMLACAIEELAALRLSIVLTARWESADSESPEQRTALRADLALLRRRYGDKIDALAMTFGVHEAMKANEAVERTVVVPREMKPLAIEREARVSQEEGGETGFGI